MGNVTHKGGQKGATVQAFHGDITRSDLIANTASVLEHLVCVSGSVTFKSFHCHEPEHDQKKCAIYVAGKIFANVICKKLSSLLIFGTNFTMCPASSVAQFFADGLRNIPKLECIEFVGCVSTRMNDLEQFFYIVDIVCPSTPCTDNWSHLAQLLSSSTQVALRTLAIISCDSDAGAIKELGAAMASNSNFRSCSFKFAPSEIATVSSDEALVSTFRNILPIVESFHLLNCNTNAASIVSQALVEVLGTTQFPRGFMLDLCPLLHGFPLQLYQDILRAISKSNITVSLFLFIFGILSLPKAEVESGTFDLALRSLIECNHIDCINLNIYEPGNFHITIPSHTCESIALSLGTPSCNLKALSIPPMNEDGAAVFLSSLNGNKSLQHLSVGVVHKSFYSALAQLLANDQNGMILHTVHPMQHGGQGQNDELKGLLLRNLWRCFRRSLTLVQLCFLTVDQNVVLKKKARSALPKDLHNKLYHFIAWKTKKLGEKGSIPVAVNFWEFASSLDWCP